MARLDVEKEIKDIEKLQADIAEFKEELAAQQTELTWTVHDINLWVNVIYNNWNKIRESVGQKAELEWNSARRGVKRS